MAGAGCRSGLIPIVEKRARNFKNQEPQTKLAMTLGMIESGIRHIEHTSIRRMPDSFLTWIICVGRLMHEAYLIKRQHTPLQYLDVHHGGGIMRALGISAGNQCSKTGESCQTYGAVKMESNIGMSRTASLIKGMARIARRGLPHILLNHR